MLQQYLIMFLIQDEINGRTSEIDGDGICRVKRKEFYRDGIAMRLVSITFTLLSHYKEIKDWVKDCMLLLLLL